MNKTYTTKSNARRAARQAGVAKEDYEIVKAADGRYTWQFIKDGDENTEEPLAKEDNAKQAQFDKGMDLVIETSEDEKTDDAGAAMDPVDEIEKEEEAEKVQAEVVHKSSIERPTREVWVIAEEMHEANPDVRRKDVIAECVKRGIAFYTARTQYQAWFAAVKASQKTEEK